MKCSICLDKLNDDDCTQLKCNHYFHKECINQWLEISNSCPYCRTIIKNKYNIYFSKYKFGFIVSKPKELEIDKNTIFINDINLKIPIKKIKTIYIKNYILEMKVNIQNKIVSRFIKGINKIYAHNVFEHLRRIMYGK